jgi:hypothetical protein
MNKIEMQQRLNTIQKEAEAIKQQLNKSFPTLQDANPGDLLEDGTVVVEKYGNAVLIAAPSITEGMCTWSKEFSDVFEALKSQGFNPSQWFVPSREQLKLAYKNAKQQFSSTSHWSSTEASSTGAYVVYFNNDGLQNTLSKTFKSYVRAFRLVEI